MGFFADVSNFPEVPESDLKLFTFQALAELAVGNLYPFVAEDQVWISLFIHAALLHIGHIQTVEMIFMAGDQKRIS